MIVVLRMFLVANLVAYYICSFLILYVFCPENTIIFHQHTGSSHYKTKKCDNERGTRDQIAQKFNYKTNFSFYNVIHPVLFSSTDFNNITTITMLIQHTSPT